MTGQTTWNELISQPNAWRQLLSRLDAGKGRPSVAFADYDEVVAIGSGTSYYLALSIADFLRRRGIDARAIPSCEVVLDAWEIRPDSARRPEQPLRRTSRLRRCPAPLMRRASG